MAFDSTSEEVPMLRQCEQMPTVIFCYLGLQFVNMLIGIPGNLMVLWLLHKNKKDPSTSDIFILYLSILDMLFCLFLPLEVASIIHLNTVGTGYVLRFFYGIKDSLPLFLLCICLDRYVAVVHPMTFSVLKYRSHRPVCAVVVTFTTLVYATMKCMSTIVTFDKVFTVMMLVIFTLMVFLNVSILQVLMQSGPSKDKMDPVKKRAFKVVLISLAIIVFNYLPTVVLFPFQEYFSKEVFCCQIRYIAFGFMDISSSIQPLLYLSKENMPCARICSSKRRAGEEKHSVSFSVTC